MYMRRCALHLHCVIGCGVIVFLNSAAIISATDIALISESGKLCTMILIFMLLMSSIIAPGILKLVLFLVDLFEFGILFLISWISCFLFIDCTSVCR